MRKHRHVQRMPLYARIQSIKMSPGRRRQSRADAEYVSGSEGAWERREEALTDPWLTKGRAESAPSCRCSRSACSIAGLLINTQTRRLGRDFSRVKVRRGACNLEGRTAGSS